jgi:hypothetical protein
MIRLIPLLVLVLAVVGVVTAGGWVLDHLGRSTIACTHEANGTCSLDPPQSSGTDSIPADGEDSCAAMVAARLGGIAAIGGSERDWRPPSWAWGAWEYLGPPTRLIWPGFGYFDTWPAYGGADMTHDFTSPPGDRTAVAAAFHCVPKEPGDPTKDPDLAAAPIGVLLIGTNVYGDDQLSQGQVAGEGAVYVAYGDLDETGTCLLRRFEQGEVVRVPSRATWQLKLVIGGSPGQRLAAVQTIQQAAARGAGGRCPAA